MEVAAFQLSYLQSDSTVCIKRNKKWSKETEDIKEASGHSGQSQLYTISFFPASDRLFHVPQVANQTFHRIADFLSCLVTIHLSSALPCFQARSQESGLSGQQRESITSAVVTS